MVSKRAKLPRKAMLSQINRLTYLGIVVRLDIATLLLLDVYILALVSLLLTHAWWRGKDRVLGVLAAAMGLAALGTLSIVLRQVMSPWVMVVLGNMLMLTGMGLSWMSLRLFAGRNLHWPGMFGGALIWAVACLVPGFMEYSSARVVLFALLFSGSAWLGCSELWRSRKVLKEDLRPALLLTFAHGAFYFLRAFVDHNPAVEANGKSSPFFSLVILETVLYAVALAFITLALVKERAELFYQHAALHDPLTGIGNRRAFVAAATPILHHCFQRHQQAVLLLCDLDHFKRVNDTYGHAAGDQALSEFGRILAARTRQQDVCARIGGEEFVCLLAEADIPAALGLAERIRNEFAGLALLEAMPLTVSIGIAEAHSADFDLSRLLSLADEALYLAKSKGRNRVECYTPS